jgi:hypothetical protein
MQSRTGKRRGHEESVGGGELIESPGFINVNAYKGLMADG